MGSKITEDTRVESLGELADLIYADLELMSDDLAGVEKRIEAAIASNDPDQVSAGIAFRAALTATKITLEVIYKMITGVDLEAGEKPSPVGS